MKIISSDAVKTITGLAGAGKEFEGGGEVQQEQEVQTKEVTERGNEAH